MTLGQQTRWRRAPGDGRHSRPLAKDNPVSNGHLGHQPLSRHLCSATQHRCAPACRAPWVRCADAHTHAVTVNPVALGTRGHLILLDEGDPYLRPEQPQPAPSTGRQRKLHPDNLGKPAHDGCGAGQRGYARRRQSVSKPTDSARTMPRCGAAHGPPAAMCAPVCELPCTSAPKGSSYQQALDLAHRASISW